MSPESFISFLVGLGGGFYAGVYYVSWKDKVQFIEAQDASEKQFTPPDDYLDTEQTQFIDAVTPKEKFDNAKNVSDLINH